MPSPEEAWQTEERQCAAYVGTWCHWTPTAEVKH